MDVDVQKALDILEEQNRCDAQGSDFPQVMETKLINLDPGQVPQQYPQQAETNPIEKTEPIGPNNGSQPEQTVSEETDNGSQPEQTVSEEKVVIDLEKDE